jgi:hypothetical protein
VLQLGQQQDAVAGAVGGVGAAAGSTTVMQAYRQGLVCRVPGRMHWVQRHDVAPRQPRHPMHVATRCRRAGVSVPVGSRPRTHAAATVMSFC